MSQFIVIFMTATDRVEAEKIVRNLLEERLIACANILGPFSSLFWWKGKIDEASEFLIIMKSEKKFFKRLSARVKEIHSYEVPELIAMPIIEGLPSYLDWLKNSLRGG